MPGLVEKKRKELEERNEPEKAKKLEEDYKNPGSKLFQAMAVAETAYEHMMEVLQNALVQWVHNLLHLGREEDVLASDIQHGAELIAERPFSAHSGLVEALSTFMKTCEEAVKTFTSVCSDVAKGISKRLTDSIEPMVAAGKFDEASPLAAAAGRHPADPVARDAAIAEQVHLAVEGGLREVGAHVLRLAHTEPAPDGKPAETLSMGERTGRIGKFVERDGSEVFAASMERSLQPRPESRVELREQTRLVGGNVFRPPVIPPDDFRGARENYLRALIDSYTRIMAATGKMVEWAPMVGGQLFNNPNADMENGVIGHLMSKGLIPGPTR